MADPIKVLGLSGSLRKKSFNSMLLRAAQSLAPEGMTVEIGDIGDLPLYDQDVMDAGIPAPVARLRSQCAAADAILFVTPEYNYSIPGGLKNAIDWASRPPNAPLLGKPAAILGASPGILGTARAQYHLRQVCVFLDMKVINKPEVFIGEAPSRFDESGNLKDEKSRAKVQELMKALHDWTLKLR